MAARFLAIDPRRLDPRGALTWTRARLPPDVLRALPYALLLALGLGIAVVVGAHLSNAQPSSDRPFGWEGPSAFEWAVAMVRKDLVFATTLPALLLGARALRERDPSRDGTLSIVGVFGTHAAMLSVAVVAAGGIGAWGAFHTPWDAYVAFVTAHTLLALSFYAIGFVWSATLSRHATALALATWFFLVLFYDNLVQIRLLREIGLPGFEAGAIPTWFYAAQAASPLTTYRGILILWRKRFRDFIEKELLERAALPSWMTPALFSTVMLVVWVLVPFALALAIWRARRWWIQRDHAEARAAKLADT